MVHAGKRLSYSQEQLDVIVGKSKVQLLDGNLYIHVRTNIQHVQYNVKVLNTKRKSIHYTVL